ncbi:teichoic acids export ABC transporter ATP-binding subunit TagH [Priestia megaterium]|uniref:teichoic acids export ABC transporter ATP-binding subunit TagH n=1 Tax=Priestia megaterium TaxID=1404 RepID=UPI002E22749D|nr:teichoic acids export ABC transporter ATP-binding subunit TagH [Priestia megaterium]MED4263444.1 teichoic acids export ABC transporter ATP-binding subunit TagH [Priestia megaterium]MED4276676.1 teichoic acids export ABC transporter ATP-binding subunit TagH [Priestia megaterium]MED4316445.1 teichoic acids export ABC transporter ATP-binding subunit TagH [Priestia megaterium]
MSYKVKFQKVTKKYKMYNKQIEKVKDLFWNRGKGEYHYALNNISFTVDEGEIVGVIGLNGSGKSTLSNLIAGVTMPNEGTVDIKGSASLIAIGAGLNNKLTGLENIELKGLMMGLTKKQIQEITPKVIEFADIGKFINQPVKTYSSGMKSRLGFAISVNIDPDILVIDEALSVGDQTFTNKCLEKMNEFKENGKTIFFISHSLSQVKSFCTKALWIHYGHVKEYGDINEVADQYGQFLKEYNKMSKEEREQFREKQLNEFSHGLLNNGTSVSEDTGEHSKEKAAESLSLSRSKRIGTKRKSVSGKKSFAKKVLLPAAAVILLGSAGYAVYAAQSASHAAKQTESKTQSSASGTAQKKQQAGKVVINTKTAFVREDPDLESNQKAVLSFGEIYQVLQEKKDPAEDIKWVKLNAGQGKEGWVSSALLTPYTEQQSGLTNKNIDSLDSLVRSKYNISISKLLSPLSETQQNLMGNQALSLTNQYESNDGTLLNYGSVQYVALNNVVTEVSLRNVDEDTEEILSLIKKKPLFINDKEGLYFYQSKNYYIKIYTNLKTNKIKIISFVSRENAEDK